MEIATSRGARAWLTAFFWLLVVFLYVPIAVLALFSLNDGDPSFPLSGFTTHWYGDVLANHVLTHALLRSLVVASASSVIAVALGDAAAVDARADLGVPRRVHVVVRRVRDRLVPGGDPADLAGVPVRPAAGPEPAPAADRGLLGGVPRLDAPGALGRGRPAGGRAPLRGDPVGPRSAVRWLPPGRSCRTIGAREKGGGPTLHKQHETPEVTGC